MGPQNKKDDTKRTTIYLIKNKYGELVDYVTDLYEAKKKSTKMKGSWEERCVVVIEKHILWEIVLDNDKGSYYVLYNKNEPKKITEHSTLDDARNAVENFRNTNMLLLFYGYFEMLRRNLPP